MPNKLTKNRILFKSQWQCSSEWEELKATDSDKVKFCADCNKNVYWVDDQQELYKLAKGNKCIAVETAKIIGAIKQPRTKVTLGVFNVA